MGTVRLLVVDDPDELSRVGADVVAGSVSAIREPRVVAAMGTTPMGLYEELAHRRGGGLFDPGRLTALQLDEYLGLEADDPRSLFGWMRRSFLEPLGIGADRVVELPLEGDLGSACAAHDEAIEAAGGIDLAILGLGPNGHLGFNEPPSDRRAPTRVVELTAATMESNARYWNGGAAVPTTAVTLGLGPLLSSRRLVLLVSGEQKRDIVHRVLEGPVGPQVPASFVQEAGGEVFVVADRAAWGGG